MTEADGTESTPPLEALDTMLGKTVTVRTKAGQLVQGTLADYDEHMNLTLGNVDAIPPSLPTTNAGDGSIVVRGTQIQSVTHSTSWKAASHG